MKIVVLAGDADFETIKRSNPAAGWVRAADVNSFAAHEDAAAFFNLTENAATAEYPVVSSPLFVNSVVYPLAPQKKAIRINGWNGFLENSTWEVAGDIGEKEKNVLGYLQKKIIVCADEPGFISARIIAMIINEAYYAKGEEVSTEAAIDTAMKLGTNYPYGPFEWGEKIGLHNVYTLLKKLSMQDSRYQPSPLLTKTSGS